MTAGTPLGLSGDQCSPRSSVTSAPPRLHCKPLEPGQRLRGFGTCHVGGGRSFQQPLQRAAQPAGIHPDRDVRLVAIPPPLMVDNLRAGLVDGFCVGEPWNAQLINQGIGFTACNTGEIWNKHPEKSFGVRAT